jgi:hypothetical protein
MNIFGMPDSLLLIRILYDLILKHEMNARVPAGFSPILNG